MRHRRPDKLFSHRPLLFLILAVFVYLPSVVLSQDESREDKKPATKSRDGVYRYDAGTTSIKEIDGETVLEGREGVRIVHGDVTITADRGIHYRGRQVTYFIGNVNIDQNTLHMQGDEGEYRKRDDIVILKKNVRIRDRGLEIDCDEAIYHRTTEHAWLKGNVVVVDSATTLTADSLYYDKATLVSEAFGDVLIVDRKEGIRLRGRHGFYYRETGVGVMDQLPRLTVDPDSTEPTTVDSDTMYFYPDKRMAVAHGRVKILKGGMVTQCDSAVVLDDDNRVELYGNPLAKQGNISMQGNKMVLGYDEEQVDRIDIIGAAMIKETQKDSLVIGMDSWVRGDSITLHMRENRLDSMSVSGAAESEYYTTGPDRVEANYALGDSMFFTFTDDSLSHVWIIGSADGAYRYIKLGMGETADSLRAARDTSYTYIPFAENAERVAYAADTIQYFAKQHELVLNHRAKVDYSGKTLLGDQITYSADLELLDATGSPLLIEGVDKLYGNRMDYDLGMGSGLVQEGATQFMDGFYDGRRIAKVGDNILKVWDSKYTTCDLKVPHYHFTSNRMKVYLDDKVVSGPIVLYIGETPIIALPFFAQNIRRGRRSGILRPTFEFGVNSSKDRFIRNIGYYWATNDYTDFTFIGDFNEDRSLRFRLDHRYKLRYSFNGGFNFSWFRDLKEFRNEWTFQGRHDQTLGEKASFNANLRFVSSDRAQKDVNRIDEVADVVDRRIESTASLRKTWSSFGFSASGRRIQLLDVEDSTTVRVATTLPSIALSVPSITLYRGEKRKAGYETVWQKVLDKVRVSPGIAGNRKVEERAFEWKEVITANANLGVSAPFKVGFVNLTPRLSVSDAYNRTTIDRWSHEVEVDDSTVVIVKGSRKTESENMLSWNTGAGVVSNFFGTFYPKVGALRALRHTMTPSVSYTYTPPRGSRGASQRFNVSLKNVIDLKIRSKKGKDETDGRREGEGLTLVERTDNQQWRENVLLEDEDDGDASTSVEKEKEIEEDLKKLPGVFIWTLSSSYNPAREFNQGWTNISSLMNVKVLRTNLSITPSIDPFDFNIISTRLSTSFTFRGHHPFGTAVATKRELNIVASDTTGTAELDMDDELDQEEDEDKGLPWNLGLAFSYSKADGFDEPNSTLNLNGWLSLTRGWRLSYRTTYDVVDRDFLGEYLSIARNLHCWQISFSRQKLGDEWEFYFKISLSALPELYAEQGSRGLGSGTFGSPFDY